MSVQDLGASSFFRRPLNMIRMLNYRCLLLFYISNRTRLQQVWRIYSGLNLNQYGIASPCRTICNVCGFVALSWFKFNPLYISKSTKLRKAWGIYWIFVITSVINHHSRLHRNNEAGNFCLNDDKKRSSENLFTKFSDDLSADWRMVYWRFAP